MLSGEQRLAARSFALEATAEAALEAPSAVQLLNSAMVLAASALPSCTSAGLIAPAGEALTAVAGSDANALRLERLQTELGEGPALDVALTGAVVAIDDLTRETRWSEFVPRALAAGVRSVLSIPIASESGVALSLYGAEPVTFGPGAQALAEPFAAHVRLVLDTFHIHEQDVVLAEQLRMGLESRTLIGQAQGILIERERITAEEAFAVLRTASQHTNVKLRDIAARVVETGEDPRTFRGVA